VSFTQSIEYFELASIPLDEHLFMEIVILLI